MWPAGPVSWPKPTQLVGVTVADETDLLAAAQAVRQLGPEAVLVKGGHLAGAESVDLLWDGERERLYGSPRYDNRHTHGTGCTLASAVASRLALGDSLPDAVYGDDFYADLRLGPDGRLYQLATSPSRGVVIRRYSLRAS